MNNTYKLNNIKTICHHNHCDASNFRLKDSITKVKILVDTAIKKGHQGVTLTDHETVAMHIQIMSYVQQLNQDKKRLKEIIKKYGENNYIQQAKNEKINYELLNLMCDNFKLGLGNEIYLVDSLELVKDKYESGVTKFPHFILIAKDKEGHKQLRELSSGAWKNSFYTGQMERVPTIKKDLENIICKNKGHIIASTACVGGEFMLKITELLNAKNNNETQQCKIDIHKFIEYCLDLFEDDFYIEIQPTTNDLIWEMNKKAVEIAKAYNIKCIITTDSHYPTKEMASIHESYLNSKDGDREVAEFYGTTYIMSVEELWEYFNSHLSFDEFKIMLNNTIEIGNKITEYSLKHEVIVPEIELGKFNLQHLFKKWYKDYEYIEKFANSIYSQDRYFLQLIEEGFIDKKQEFNIENISRINIELKELFGVSEKLNQRMSSYYNLVEYIVDLMWDDNRGNSFVGVARGSVTGFYTCFLIGISQMNPIKWGLPHWRHLTAERVDGLPDIDLDTEAAKRQNIFRACKEDFGFNNVLNITTFKTEGSKSSVLTACRGMHINNDVAQFIADMIPFERGKSWTLTDCFFGNKSDNRQPLKEFINVVNQHEGLQDIMLAIEGLIVGRSIHASGLYIFKNGYLEQNAMMKAPNGDYITQWSMQDSDWCGGLKVDFLTIEAEDKIRVCSELLLKYKKIKWMGNWRITYNNFLHPDIINYTNKNMWEKVKDNKIESLFQFVTPVGLATAKELKPSSLSQLADSNSLMRLMTQDGSTESPVKTYVKYKENIELWYQELRDCGLIEEEIKVLEPHLLPVYGVASTQEDIMEISMNPKISNFDIVLSNKLRKSIAKKDKKAQEEIKKTFFEKGKENGTSEKLLKYIWDVQIMRQIGYSFSRNHTYPYSNIAVQEMNLAHFYNPIFWNCACLTIDSGAIKDYSNYSDGEENHKDKVTNYGKMAHAIGKMRQRNIKIVLPDINKAEQSFTPDEENNEIIFGFKGIMKINNEIAQIIMQNRPYTNLKDFHDRLVLIKKEVTLKTGKTQMRSLVAESQTIMLIKAGAFDKIENKPREQILENYLRLLHPSKQKLNSKDIAKIAEMGIIPTSLKDEMKLYNFREYLTAMEKKRDERTKTIMWHKIHDKHNEDYTDYANNFFMEHFANEMEENRDYKYDEEGYLWIALGTSRKGSFEYIYKNKTTQLSKWINTEECKKIYTNNIFENIKNDFMQGTISSWEMESMNYYYHQHELTNVNKEKYGIVDFYSLPEEPIIIGFTKYKGLQYPKFQLDRIIGTVLDRDKNKHSVTILTPEGVVTLKFYSGQFSFYDKTISKDNGIDDKGKTKKIILENGWFKRSELLLVTGFRRGDIFKPKRYKNSIYQHSIQRIVEVKEDGTLILQSDRIQLVE